MTRFETRQLAVNDKVYCTVPAVRGWYSVLDVRTRDGYIKISGFNTWNPPHNFELVDSTGKTWEKSQE